MVYLRDILDEEKLAEHLANGVVRSQVHPRYPELFILNYTEKAQYDRIWDPVTNVCRGLIIQRRGDNPDVIVIARAFNKFHNLNTEYVPETMEENLVGRYIDHITEKLDGSLGIIFYYDNLWHVATRGSFASDQSIWATEFLREHLRHTALLHPEEPFPVGWTPVCEIIYAANRIVVEYDYEGLVLLAFVDPYDAHEMPRPMAQRVADLVGLPLVKRFKKTLSECAAENTSNFEGYVITYLHGVKVKVKFEEYVRLHRILTGMSPIAVWEMKKNGQDEEIEKLLADPKMPEGFRAWLDKWNKKLRNEFWGVDQVAHTLQARLREAGLVKPPLFAINLKTGEQEQVRPEYTREERKALAAAVFKVVEEVPYQKGFQFALADGKDIKEDIWDYIRPSGKDVDPFKKDGE